MNLHGIVARAIGAVNPLITASIQVSAGYTTNPDGTQVPAYAPAITAPIQVQALTAMDLKLIDGLNLQDETRAVYLNGNFEGVLRPEDKGGDLLTFNGQTWLTTQILEQWPNWSKLAVILQDAAAADADSGAIDLTESSILTALRSYLLSILPNEVEIVRSQSNRVPSPAASDYVVMTPGLRERLETNRTNYSDQPLASPPVGTSSSEMSTKMTVQLDVHGPFSADNTQIIATLFRSQSSCDFFAATGFNMAPLYTSEPRQLNFETAERQNELRWIVDVVLQINPIITQAQDFADKLTVGVHSVDVEFPPT